MQKFSFAASKATTRRLLLIAYRASSDLAGKGAYFIITVVAARLLSEAGFALFSLASVLGWLLALASDGGIQLHLARSIARTPSSAGTILRRWLRVRLWTTAAAVAAAAFGGMLLPDRAQAAPVFLIVLVYAINGLTELLHYFYRAIERSDVESSLILWQRGGLLACGLCALAIRPDVTWLAVAMLLPAAGACAFSIWFALRLSGRTVHPAARSVERAPVLSDLWSEALPIGVGVVLSALYFRIDLFLVQLWRGAEAVAFYSAAFRLVEALRLFPAAVLAVVLPSVFRAQTASPLVRLSIALTLCAVAGSTILWATAGWVIPLLYGARYGAAVPAFRILVWSFPLLSLNYALTHQLIGWNGQRPYAWICAAALALNLALNAVLIPAQSIAGAAWATLLTEIALTLGCALALPAAYRRWRSHAPVPAAVAVEGL